MSGRRAFQGLQKIFLGIILCFGIWGSAQQQHPVRITPVMTPPYSLLLPEIAQSSQDKIQLHILMTDLNEPSHQVSLRFKLLSGTSSSVIAQSTPFVNGLPTQNLLPGQPIILSNLDVRPLFQLQNLAGINPQQYAKPLPQGLYQFCFQVIDQHTRRELSNFSCIPVYLQQYEPPFLTLPKNAEIIQKQNEFQNILFQWMPRQIAPNTQYTFTLKEINDNIRDPHSAFLTARTLWQENTLAPNLFYGIDKTPLITGKRYAWQVKATSANPALPNFSINPNDDTGIYQNNGLSEIFFFDYTEHCALPKFLIAKNQGRGKTQILWSFNQYQPHKQYLVQYRKKDSHKDWAEIKTYAENAFITNLEDLTTYEYRVGASCNQTTDGRVQFAFSDIQTFTTDSKQTQNQNYQCGVMPSIDLANQQLFQGSLGANDTFTAGDFPVTILEAEGQNGIFSGKGYIQVPYLADTKIIVAFDNISINTDRRLINGVLETEYDPNEKNVMGVTTAIGELFGDAGAKNMTLNYTIKDIKVVDGKIIIYGNAGEGNAHDNGTNELSQQELELGRDYAITDASGKIFNIDENGNITDAGTLAKGGGSNPQNTDGVDKNGKVTQYTAEGVSIEWKEKTDSRYDRNTQYAFDTEQTSKLGNKGKYPKIKTQKGKLIYAPFKAVVNGKTDRLEAIVHISDDKKLENSEIVFKTVKGKSIKADLEHQSDHQRKYTLTLQGTFNYAEEEVIATIVPKDSLQKQQVISSFTLVHLEPKKIKLSLVPLDEKAKGRLDDIKKNIIDTYKTVGVEFDIQEKEVLDISSIVSGNTIDTEDKDFASTYSKQQNAINALYPDKEERYVLFVTSKNSSKNLKGYFRLNGQFGYIFSNADEKTPAHEVGHGVFKLEHPWTAYKTPEGKTNLLMDNSKGQILSHLDWEQINDPKLKIYAFQKQQEGEFHGGYAISPDYKIFSVGSSTTYYNTQNNVNIPEGTLYGFVQNNKYYYWNSKEYITEQGDIYKVTDESKIYDTNKFIFLFFDKEAECGGRTYASVKSNSRLSAEKILKLPNEKKILSCVSTNSTSNNSLWTDNSNNQTNNTNSFTNQKFFNIRELALPPGVNRVNKDKFDPEQIKKAVQQVNTLINRQNTNYAYSMDMSKNDLGNIFIEEGISEGDHNLYKIDHKLVYLSDFSRKGKNPVNIYVLFTKIDFLIQGNWNRFAQQVYETSNLKDRNAVLITVPYFSISNKENGVDFSVSHYMPGVYAKGINVNTSNIARIEVLSSNKMAKGGGKMYSSVSYTDIINFIQQVYKQTYKPYRIHLGRRYADGSITANVFNSSEHQPGYNFVNTILLQESSYYQKIKELHDHKTDFSLIGAGAGGEWTPSENTYLALLERELKKAQLLESAQQDKKQWETLEHSIEFKEKYVDKEARMYILNYAFKQDLYKWKQDLNNVIGKQPSYQFSHTYNKDSWSTIDPIVYGGLDIAGMVPGVDTVTDPVGLAYSLSRGDATNAAIYTTAMAVPILSSGEIKGAKQLANNARIFYKGAIHQLQNGKIVLDNNTYVRGRILEFFDLPNNAVSSNDIDAFIKAFNDKKIKSQQIKDILKETDNIKRVEKFKQYTILHKKLIEGKSIFKATDEEIAEATKRIKDHRIAQKAGDRGNFGYLEGIINGKKVDNKIVRSGQADQNISEIFEAIKVNSKQEIEGMSAWLRTTDSEYKMLNRLANELGAEKGKVYKDIIGELKIISERAYCPSCQGVIQQFNEMFPNIKLILIDNVK